MMAVVYLRTSFPGLTLSGVFAPRLGLGRFFVCHRYNDLYEGRWAEVMMKNWRLLGFFLPLSSSPLTRLYRLSSEAFLGSPRCAPCLIHPALVPVQQDSLPGSVLGVFESCVILVTLLAPGVCPRLTGTSTGFLGGELCPQVSQTIVVWMVSS
ncbi:hypothetical protein LZ30DRAFT_729737 [Colletotrichum cereale]|nr:hypothetical protein LZ30DRAFT_729737 [Colletotrichum cereale]